MNRKFISKWYINMLNNKFLFGLAAASMLFFSPVNDAAAQEYEDYSDAGNPVYMKVNYNLAYGLGGAGFGAATPSTSAASAAGQMSYAGLVGTVGVNLDQYDFEVEGFYQMKTDNETADKKTKTGEIAFKNANYGGIVGVSYNTSAKDSPVNLYAGVGLGYAAFVQNSTAAEGVFTFAHKNHWVGSLKTGVSYDVEGDLTYSPYSDVRILYVFDNTSNSNANSNVIGNLEVGVKFNL